MPSFWVVLIVAFYFVVGWALIQFHIQLGVIYKSWSCLSLMNSLFNALSKALLEKLLFFIQVVGFGWVVVVINLMRWVLKVIIHRLMGCCNLVRWTATITIIFTAHFLLFLLFLIILKCFFSMRIKKLFFLKKYTH